MVEWSSDSSGEDEDDPDSPAATGVDSAGGDGLNNQLMMVEWSSDSSGEDEPNSPTATKHRPGPMMGGMLLSALKKKKTDLKAVPKTNKGRKKPVNAIAAALHARREALKDSSSDSDSEL